MKKMNFWDKVLRLPAVILGAMPYSQLLIVRYSRLVNKAYKNKEQLYSINGDYSLLLNLRRATDLRRYWGYFEIDMSRYLAKHLKPGMKVLDVGAQKGTYTYYCGNEIQPNGLVVAIEPVSSNYEALSKAYEIAEFAEVIKLRQCALSAFSGEVRLSLNGPHVVLDENESTVVPALTIDDLVDEYGSFDLVKIDTDGHEMEIVEGARRSLKGGSIKQIIVEASNFSYQDGQSLLNKVQVVMSEYGYKMKVLNSRGLPVAIEKIPKLYREREMHALFTLGRG